MKKYSEELKHQNPYLQTLAEEIAPHIYDMNRLNLPYFDVLICNLYPFLDNQIIEKIYIGGVSLPRPEVKILKIL